MITQVSALQIFILVGAAQGFILAANILFYHQRNSENIFLAIGLLILSFRLLIYPFKDASELLFWRSLSNFSLIGLLLVGPFFYLFISHKMKPGGGFKSLTMLHFVPFLIYFTHLIYPHFKLYICYSYATLYSGIFYGFLCIWKVNGFELNKLFKTSHYQFNSFALPLLVIPSSIYELSYLKEPLLNLHPATFPYLLLTFLFYRMSFRSLKGSRKFFKELLETSPAKTSIDPSRLEKLTELLKNEQLYLDHDITVVELAIRTGYSRHEISELINVGAGLNFNEFINRYRVEHFKEKLVDPSYSHLTILGIAQESGFRSKSTFHQVFKDNTGMTPREYLIKNR